ncbi:hypothetical protein Spiro2_002025 [Spirobacillus cienkowskii]
MIKLKIKTAYAAGNNTSENTYNHNFSATYTVVNVIHRDI